MAQTTNESSFSPEDGFGLVEVVVAMFMLALLALAFLPLLIQGIKQSAQSATIATATQFVHDQLDSARVQAQAGACSAITALASTDFRPGGTALTDSRGVPLQLSRTPGACPTPYPSTVSFTVKVVRTDTGQTVSQATTLIFVSSN